MPVPTTDSNFAAFKRSFNGDLVIPSDPSYPSSIARWALNAQRPAAIVAFVKGPVDVVSAIRYACAQALPLAIRGGGHSAAGASSTTGGLVIDLSRYVSGVRVDPERRLAYVGGGALWEAVDMETAKYGLATVAGTVNHTGVGGLTLGGGYGWLSPKHGLVIDNLVQATMVTADGSVLTVDDATNPDLFFAIRGGGCNFGVVTEFVFKLHPQRSTVYSGRVVFPPESLERVVEATKSWWANAGENEAMMQVLSLNPDGKPSVVIYPFFNGSEAEGRSAFRSFFDIGPLVDKTKEFPYEELNGFLNPGMCHAQGIYMKGVQHQPSYPSTASTLDKIISLSTPNFRIKVIYEYFPLAKILSVPQDMSAFRRDANPGVLVIAQWENCLEETTERGRSAVHEIARLVTDGRPELGLGYSNNDAEAVPGERVSTTGKGTLDKAKLVFADNYPRLQAIKKRYDPQNIFNKWFPITPA